MSWQISACSAIVIWVIDWNYDSGCYQKTHYCFLTFILSESMKTPTGMDTVKLQGRLDNTCICWKYCCTSLQQYSKTTKKHRGYNVSANWCLFISQFIRSISLLSMFLVGFMHLHQLKANNFCSWYLLAHGFSVLLFFNSSHNDTVDLGRL